jgi:hypothetical protein
MPFAGAFFYMNKPTFRTKIIARALLLNDASVSQEKMAQAKEHYLEERGKFPGSIVNQPDTLALQAVILTTGRPGNLNDDVMLNEEVLPVLWTAALKPFNVEHSKVVIGCMFDAFAVDRESGKVVASMEEYNEGADDEEHEKEEEALEKEIATLPENLDIITNQVLWPAHFPLECANIKRKAIAGEMFVSMEVWFTEFDYLIGNRIVKRTPELASILDSKLRIKGGKGYFGVDKIKRVPRNLTFAGNAAVETPANPDSIILDVMDRGDVMDDKEMEHEEECECEAQLIEDKRILALVESNTLGILESLSDSGKVSETKSDVLEAGRSSNHLGNEAPEFALATAEVGEVVKVSEVKKMLDEQKLVELLEANAVLKSKQTEVEAALAAANKEKEDLQAKNADLEAKLNETLALVKEKEDALAAKAGAFEQLQADKNALETKFGDTSAKLAQIEEQRKLDTRKTALAGIGLSTERIVKVLAKTNELSDEAFASEVEDLKALMAELAPAKVPASEVAPAVIAVVAEVPAPELEEVEATEEELAEVLEETEEEPVPAAAAVGAVRTDMSEDVEHIRSAMAKVLGK